MLLASLLLIGSQAPTGGPRLIQPLLRAEKRLRPIEESVALPAVMPLASPVAPPVVVPRTAVARTTATPTSPELDARWVHHTVGVGETLSSIARQYQTRAEVLRELNGLIDPNALLVGQELIVGHGATSSWLPEYLSYGANYDRQIIGISSGGHSLEAFQIGDGQYNVIVVGAIHGGYEWNTGLLAYRLLTYFTTFPERLPPDVALHIIPVANPDGLFAVTGKTGPFMVADVSGDTVVGRLNSNSVDLNRNWGCEWSAEGVWRDQKVSAGARPLSEPENKALRSYFLAAEPQVVIWLHSAAGLVVPGNCQGIRHLPSETAAALYGEAAGYPVGGFTAYRVTGDAADWLAQHNVASFTVELTDHQVMEFAQNLAGLTSILDNVEILGED